jgi:hypothetical protein
MKDFWLSNEQLAELRAAHRSERNKHAAYKIKAVILLGSGWRVNQVKEALLLDDETLRSYVEKYQSGGIEALVKTHYLGRLSQLDEIQRQRDERLAASSGLRVQEAEVGSRRCG